MYYKDILRIFANQEAALRTFHISESPSKFSLTEVSNAGKSALLHLISSFILV